MKQNKQANKLQSMKEHSKNLNYSRLLFSQLGIISQCDRALSKINIFVGSSIGTCLSLCGQMATDQILRLAKSNLKFHLI